MLPFLPRLHLLILTSQDTLCSHQLLPLPTNSPYKSPNSPTPLARPPCLFPFLPVPGPSTRDKLGKTTIFLCYLHIRLAVS